METATPASDLERRKQVRIRVRTDLSTSSTRYEGRTFYVIKDPVSLRYYRFKEQENFLLGLMDGTHTLDDAQKKFEERFRPERLTLEDLETFAQQLLTSGLVHNESPMSGKQLYERRFKRLRREWMMAYTNILYLKVPLIDPDRILNKMLPWCRFVFTTWFFLLSCLFCMSALLLVATHFDAFREKLPSFREFMTLKNVAFMWVALGITKVIHEFGHGLSCKVFGGEVHEMGALFLCLSPCLYCNVSDAWTLPNKWHRMIIGGAGIYVELVIAAAATFVWWNSASHPIIHNLTLSLMVVCSVSTVIFNGNPLMRFDGYYVLSDWLEIPNLREKSTRYVKALLGEFCLGIEAPKEPYMALWRRILFVTYAFTSYIYRWVITFGILMMVNSFLKPHKLAILGYFMGFMAVLGLFGMPTYRFIDNYRKRGRLPDMKSERVTITVIVAGILLLVFFFVPLPVSRVRTLGVVQLQPEAEVRVYVPPYGGDLLQIEVDEAKWVEKGEILAKFYNRDLDSQLKDAEAQCEILKEQIKSLRDQAFKAVDPAQRGAIEAKLVQAEGDRNAAEAKIKPLRDQIDNLTLRAPSAGVVMGLPDVDEIGKFWDREQDRPFCKIGNPDKLRVLVPVPPLDYRLLKEDLQVDKNLAVTIRVQGRSSMTWQGRITMMQEAEAKTIPAHLAAQHGGPIPTTPSSTPGVYAPQSQQYLVGIDLLDPDQAICPGTMAQVKIHCRWRSCAWWLWRTISSIFDLGISI